MNPILFPMSRKPLPPLVAPSPPELDDVELSVPIQIRVTEAMAEWLSAQGQAAYFELPFERRAVRTRTTVGRGDVVRRCIRTAMAIDAAHPKPVAEPLPPDTRTEADLDASIARFGSARRRRG